MDIDSSDIEAWGIEAWNIDTFARRFQSGLDVVSTLPLGAARDYYDTLCASFAAPLPANVQLHDDRINGCPVRHLRPEVGDKDGDRGRVVYVHGGGFCLGSVNSHQGIAAGLACELQREVVSIGYRKMPEARYDQAIADCRNVIHSLKPVAVVGDSAGARLIIDTLSSLTLPQLEVTPVVGLIYPLVGTPHLDSLGDDAPLLSRADVMQAWSLIRAHAPPDNTHQVPAPRMEVLAVEHDPLTRPLERAVQGWRDSGADIGYRCAANMLHGALHAREQLPEMKIAWQRFCVALDDRLAQTPCATRS
ncbi:alpha/beta hydrolase fold domain-containing protein [Halomonas binhaiensis]|uniref:Alpha/beta hydrolase fold domain-containing protein n=1 Tax=Halomonas binhaiensis TaxID=2562282 RepID=A0A5C1NF28_9GAMM|nr:alpha/beta hydrolase fold domain-containing protein [Halomonas binhaiensis]QEM81834.1 alpha/beta hydrolase fold domain-containing protein [Halomonas binhaiensis]